MAFKVSSLLVWLLATLSLTATVLQRVAAQDCTEELSACEADTVCAECTAVDDTFNQVYEECMASQYYYSNCDNYLLKACCQHQASENDCLANEMFVTVWWCYLPGCTYTFPGVASCSDILGVSVTSNGVSDPGTTPAPIAAPAPELTDSPVAAPVAAAPTAPAPVAAAPTAAETVEAGEVTTVTVSANAFDERTDTVGCAPAGCTAENTRDGDLADVSRWSCSGELVAAGGGAAGEECQIVYEFLEVQLVSSVAVAFFSGDTRTRALNINVNGALHTVVESSGTTAGLEAFEIDAEDVLSLGLESTGLAADEYISITEVEFQVAAVDASPPAVAPMTPAPAAVTSAPVTVVTSPPTVAPTSTVTSAPAAVVTSPPTVAPTSTVTSAPAAVVVSSPTAAPAAEATSAPVAEVATPAPTASGTLSRDLELTPSPTTAVAGSDASPEDTTTTTASSIPTDDVCFDCYDDEDCTACIYTTDENEAEYDQCMEDVAVAMVDACDAVFGVWCCRAAVSGNDCMSIEAYVDFLSCTVEGSSLCSIDDMDCTSVSDFATAGDSAGSAVAVSYSTAILTFALGLAAAVAAGL